MAEAKEHITDEQIEKLFKLAEEIVRAPSRFTKDFIVENLALGVADLSGVIDRLRAQLAELGEMREEFGYRYSKHSNGDGGPDETGYDDEVTARRIANHGDTIMRRRVGDWEVLPDA